MWCTVVVAISAQKAYKGKALPALEEADFEKARVVDGAHTHTLTMSEDPTEFLMAPPSLRGKLVLRTVRADRSKWVYRVLTFLHTF